MLVRSILFGWLLLASAGGCMAQRLSIELPRHAYYRGEKIPVTVTLSQAAKDARLELWLNAERVVVQRFGGGSAVVVVPTAAVKVRRYTLKALVIGSGYEI